jgi:L-amino acid N-acyltransferase YncA
LEEAGVVLTYQVEPWSKVLPEMMGHWPAHWEEVAADREHISLDPDLDRYAQMERSGTLHLITARMLGELVGYSVWIVGPHLHHRSTMFGVSDMYWLRPDCRKGMAGVRLIRESVRYLKSLGVRKIVSTFQPCRALDAFYVRLGFEQAERVYSKYVGT